MPVYKFQVIMPNGVTMDGTETAISESELVARLRERRQLPISVEEVVQKDMKDFSLFNRVGVKELALFSRQFSTMITSGVTIVSTLDILRQQTSHPRLRSVIHQLYEDVQKGYSFSGAMERHRNIFPDLMINMVEAGEASGNLDGVTKRMAVHFEKEHKINNRVKNAMVYPVVLAVLAVSVVIFLLAFVMPTFVGMFEGSGVELPGLTRFMLSLTQIIRGYWYILLGVVLFFVYAWKRYTATDEGIRFVDGLRLRMPLFKGLTQKANATRFCRTLSTMLSSGIPLMQSLDNVAGAVGNVIVADAVLSAKEDVRKGLALSFPIRRCGLFPPMVDNMIKIGEESGALDEMLEKTAEFFDEEVETEVQRLLSFMEPMMIIIMAVIIGFIVVAMMLPMFDMIQTVQ